MNGSSAFAGPAPRLAVVDDHEAVRLGLSAARLRDGITVVAEGANVAELFARLDGRLVDVSATC